MHKLIFAAAMLVMLGFLASANAQGGIGTSTIVIKNTSVSMAPGGSTGLDYTVQLSSGSTWGTTISAANQSYLNSKGITLSFSNSYGDPTYSGVLTISAAAGAVPGAYSIELYATGDDPTTSPTYLTLDIMRTVNQTAPSTSSVNAPPSTTASSVTTSYTTPIPQTTKQPQGNSTAKYVGIAIVAIIVVAIAAYFLMRKK